MYSAINRLGFISQILVICILIMFALTLARKRLSFDRDRRL